VEILHFVQNDLLKDSSAVLGTGRVLRQAQKAEFENKLLFPLTKVSFYCKLDMESIFASVENGTDKGDNEDIGVRGQPEILRGGVPRGHRRNGFVSARDGA